LYIHKPLGICYWTFENDIFKINFPQRII